MGRKHVTTPRPAKALPKAQEAVSFELKAESRSLQENRITSFAQRGFRNRKMNFVCVNIIMF